MEEIHTHRLQDPLLAAEANSHLEPGCAMFERESLCSLHFARCRDQTVIGNYAEPVTQTKYIYHKVGKPL